jgi:hypothetical protein
MVFQSRREPDGESVASGRYGVSMAEKSLDRAAKYISHVPDKFNSLGRFALICGHLPPTLPPAHVAPRVSARLRPLGTHDRSGQLSRQQAAASFECIALRW